jgi:hypothetical protein
MFYPALAAPFICRAASRRRTGLAFHRHVAASIVGQIVSGVGSAGTQFVAVN